MITILFSSEGLKAISVYFMEAIILIAFLRFIFTKDDRRKEFQKIIGGLIVFIVAIIANNPWVYFMSLFIGGLIIASEEFLKFIFAVWKTDPKNIDKTIQSFSSATVEQIKKKEEEEIKIISKSKKIKSSELKTLREKYKDAELKIHEIFEKTYGKSYVREVNIRNKYGSMVFDGGITSGIALQNVFTEKELSERNDLGIQSAIEIKFFKKGSNLEIQHVIRKLVERISFCNFILHYKIVIVIENGSESQANELYKDLLEQYSNRHEFEFYIYSYSGGKVKILTPCPIEKKI